MNPLFIAFDIDGVKAIAIYEYNEFVKKLIYLYKGCFDYEMREVFLNLYFREIRMRYRDYVVIPIPSYKGDDDKRGFNHVVETFNLLGLKMMPIINKTAHHKQAESKANNRNEISKYLILNSRPNLHNCKVLIVDDIYTTGATMMAAIKLVQQLNPKKIKVLVLAKTKNKMQNKSNTNNF